MKLSSSTNVTIQFSLNRPELNLNFFIFKNKYLEGIGTMILDQENPMTSIWTGDLTKGIYQIVPFPIEQVKSKKSGKSWVKISEKDKRGEIRLTQPAKSGIMKSLQLFDTSGNGTLDKNEFTQFQMRTEEVDNFDEELWNIIKENFEVNNDELTTRGFVTIHEAQLQQEGEEEIKTLFIY